MVYFNRHYHFKVFKSCLPQILSQCIYRTRLNLSRLTHDTTQERINFMDINVQVFQAMKSFLVLYGNTKFINIHSHVESSRL